MMVECKMGERTRILEGVMMMLRYLLVMAVLKMGQPKMNQKMVMMIWQMSGMEKMEVRW